MALTPYSVSPFVTDHRRLPNPKKNSVTFMPVHLAVAKWPSSWSITISTTAKITATVFSTPVRVAAKTPAARIRNSRKRAARLSSIWVVVLLSLQACCLSRVVVSRCSVDAGHGGGGALPRLAVCIENDVDVLGVPTLARIQGLFDHIGDRQPGDEAFQEGGHGHLIGGIEPGRCGSPCPARLVGQAQ